MTITMTMRMTNVATAKVMMTHNDKQAEDGYDDNEIIGNVGDTDDGGR